MRTNAFKIGDKVKLKAYAPFEDWIRHKNEIATIIGEATGDFDWRLQWKSGDASCSPEKNMISDRPIPTNINEIFSYYQKEVE